MYNIVDYINYYSTVMWKNTEFSSIVEMVGFFSNIIPMWHEYNRDNQPPQFALLEE